jgi:hypothetical protein
MDVMSDATMGLCESYLSVLVSQLNTVQFGDALKEHCGHPLI